MSLQDVKSGNGYREVVRPILYAVTENALLHDVSVDDPH
jgi:hypothetical protein